MYQCSAKQEPLCGTDGKTYRNQCELDKFNCENKVGTVVSKKHIGACGMSYTIFGLCFYFSLSNKCGVEY